MPRVLLRVKRNNSRAMRSFQKSHEVFVYGGSSSFHNSPAHPGVRGENGAVVKTIAPQGSNFTVLLFHQNAS